MRIDFSNYKEIVTNSWTTEELSLAEIEIVEIIGQLHIDLTSTTLSWSKAETKADLGVANALLEMCRERKTLALNSETRINRKFKEIAKKMLVKEVFDIIHKESIKPKVIVVDETRSQLKAEYLETVFEHKNES